MKKILILSGPTHEYIDPVRFIANASSGIMGKEISKQLSSSFHISFISGPVNKNNLPEKTDNIDIYNVISANEMNNKALDIFPNVDICIFAAAVCDYQPKKKYPHKISSSQKNLSLELLPTEDIAKNIGNIKKSNQICIGFSLQHDDDVEFAYNKLINKKLDLIILNHPSSIGTNNGQYTFIDKNKNIVRNTDVISKKKCSMFIYDYINDQIKR